MNLEQSTLNGGALRRTGTREWSEHSKNIFAGCAHNCRYCYAAEMAMRFKWMQKREHWPMMLLKEKALNETPRKLDGRIMFPTTHDITTETLPLVVPYLRGWLEAGNEMLIVTKPHFEVIDAFCNEFKEFKNSLIFRFTIGSTDNECLDFWEPGAPDFQERLASLKLAHLRGYTTSLSIEPYLDGSVLEIVRLTEPYITDTIWIGKMNQIRCRVDMSGWTDRELEYLRQVETVSRVKWVRCFYNALKDNPKIRWKDSIRTMLDLPEAQL